MVGLCVFFVCTVSLLVGYIVYGRLAERVYGMKLDMVMPCVRQYDGVDYVALPTWKIFLIQLLNIAGLGPVVGAVSGCLFGPIALLWIVLGCLFAGAVHDFLAALLSLEYQGAGLPDVMGKVMGKRARQFFSLVCVFLLVMVGVVFTLLPAGMLQTLLPAWGLNVLGWSSLIMLYYFLATILPIHTIIGRIYPLFGAIFLFMAVGLLVGLPLSGYEVLPVLDVTAITHPQGIGAWPMIFVTIACGAISGFHATQSPMMVRCLKQAGNMRRVFYGAMVVEGLVALIWATVGLSLRDIIFDCAGEAMSFAQISVKSPSLAINVACRELLGESGALLAVLGVVVLAITSGDTAMRSCRLILAEMLSVQQKRTFSRLALAVPLFVVVIIISQLDFSVIWRYFGWANQALACLTLWCVTLHLRRHGRNCWMSLVPALFMTTVCITFLLYASECGIGLPLTLATLVGGCVTAALGLVFLFTCRTRDESAE